jgi:hypothetical protein
MRKFNCCVANYKWLSGYAKRNSIRSSHESYNNLCPRSTMRLPYEPPQEQGQVVGSSEHRNEPSGSIEYGNFLTS